jgi:SAM-dependent methyltransferase
MPIKQKAPPRLSEGTQEIVTRIAAIPKDRVTPHEAKFANVEPRVAGAYNQARLLGLHQAPPLDVLDIGIGGGYFLYACAKLGHRALGLDRPSLPYWQEMWKALGVDVVEHTVRPGKKLPDLGRRFDFVTSFKCPFNYVRKQRRFWTLEEWSFFLDDIEGKYLKPGGSLVLMIKGGRFGEPNQTEHPEFMAFWMERGGTCKGRCLYLRKQAWRDVR